VNKLRLIADEALAALIWLMARIAAPLLVFALERGAP